MTYYLRTVGKQADLVRFPLQSAIGPVEPSPPDPRDKRPIEIERINDNDQMLPFKDEPIGDQEPLSPPQPQREDRALF